MGRSVFSNPPRLQGNLERLQPLSDPQCGVRRATVSDTKAIIPLPDLERQLRLRGEKRSPMGESLEAVENGDDRGRTVVDALVEIHQT